MGEKKRLSEVLFNHESLNKLYGQMQKFIADRTKYGDSLDNRDAEIISQITEIRRAIELMDRGILGEKIDGFVSGIGKFVGRVSLGCYRTSGHEGNKDRMVTIYAGILHVFEEEYGDLVFRMPEEFWQEHNRLDGSGLREMREKVKSFLQE